MTGTQLAKMLLVSLGYKSENEGFTGNAWATNVNTIASAKGLYEGLEKLDVSAALTRDSAARMIWNALQAYEVEYKTSLIAGPDGKLSTQITVQDKVVGSTNDKITLLADKYDAWISVGTLVNVDGKNLNLSMTTEDIVVSDYYKTDMNGDTVLGYYANFAKLDKDYSDLLGQKVKVVFKNGKTNEVIGVYATGDNVVYKTLLNNVEKDGSKIKFDGKSYSIDEATNAQGTVEKGKIKVITIGVDGKSTSTMSVAEFDTAKNKYDPSEVTFVDSDNNDKIDTAIIIKKTAAKVTYASSSEIVAGDTYKYEDENIDKDFAKDDYAVISENLYKDCKNIVKAEVLNDTLKGYKEKKDDSTNVYYQYQIGSTWYNTSKKFSDVDTGDKVKAYVYNGVAFDISSDDSTGALPSVAVVTGVGGDTITGDQVKLTFFDGTTKTVTLDKVVDKDGTALAGGATLGTAYSYTESKDGYKLTQLEAKKYGDYTAIAGVADFGNFNVKHNSNMGNGGSATPSSDTLLGTKVADEAVIVLFQNNGKCKVVTGKQYKALANDKIVNDGSTAASIGFTKKVNGITQIALGAVYVADKDATGTSNDNYGYIVSAGYKTGDNYTSYTIWTGEKNVEVTEKVNYTSDKNNENARLKGDVIGYSNIDADGYITDVNKYAADSASATPAKGTDYAANTLYMGGIQGINGTSWITMDGTNKLNITKDTKILNIDSNADNDNEIGKAGTALVEAEEIASSGQYYINAFYIMDESLDVSATDKADVALVIVDLKGKMQSKNKVATAVSAVTGDTKIDTAAISPSVLEAGKTYTLSLTAKAGVTGNVKVTLTGAVFEDGKADSATVKFDETGKASVNIIPTGSATITVAGADASDA